MRRGVQTTRQTCSLLEPPGNLPEASIRCTLRATVVAGRHPVAGSEFASSHVALRTLTTLAVACYAANSALKAIRHELDVIGALAIITAVGGVTARDLLLDRPVFWIHDPLLLYVAGLTALALMVMTGFTSPHPRVLILTDTIGLALIALIGAHAANATGAPFVSTVLTGGLTGFGGGIARDLLCGEVPGVLKRDIHATAAISGAAVYLGAERLGATEAACLGGVADRRRAPRHRDRMGDPSASFSPVVAQGGVGLVTGESASNLARHPFGDARDTRIARVVAGKRADVRQGRERAPC